MFTLDCMICNTLFMKRLLRYNIVIIPSIHINVRQTTMLPGKTMVEKSTRHELIKSEIIRPYVRLSMSQGPVWVVSVCNIVLNNSTLRRI